MKFIIYWYGNQHSSVGYIYLLGCQFQCTTCINTSYFSNEINNIIHCYHCCHNTAWNTFHFIWNERLTYPTVWTGIYQWSMSCQVFYSIKGGVTSTHYCHVFCEIDTRTYHSSISHAQHTSTTVFSPRNLSLVKVYISQAVDHYVVVLYILISATPSLLGQSAL